MMQIASREKYVPPKHQLPFNGLHGVMLQKTEFFSLEGRFTIEGTINGITSILKSELNSHEN
jgi:hypothetical protein